MAAGHGDTPVGGSVRRVRSVFRGQAKLADPTRIARMGISIPVWPDGRGARRGAAGAAQLRQDPIDDCWCFLGTCVTRRAGKSRGSTVSVVGLRALAGCELTSASGAEAIAVTPYGGTPKRSRALGGENGSLSVDWRAFRRALSLKPRARNHSAGIAWPQACAEDGAGGAHPLRRDGNGMFLYLRISRPPALTFPHDLADYHLTRPRPMPDLDASRLRCSLQRHFLEALTPAPVAAPKAHRGRHDCASATCRPSATSCRASVSAGSEW